MSHQIWITCPKSKAQDIKSLLGETLCRTQKIRKSQTLDQVMVPTEEYRNAYQDGENTTAFADKFFYQILDFPPDPDLDISIELLPKVIVGASQSPTEMAVSKWLLSLPEEFLREELEVGIDVEMLVKQVPKRWSVYHPMVLLPTGSFQDEQWKYLLERIRLQSEDEWVQLWESILGAIEETEGKDRKGERKLTHLAINAAIPLQHGTTRFPGKGVDNCSGNSNQKQDLTDLQNFLRSPSGLVMLYGDFGPTINEKSESIPTQKDFSEAFWVSTNQNGIYQTWAPRYTMFSRGNIKEKARLLNFHNTSTSINHRNNILKPEIIQRQTAITEERMKESIAVDLYAGIGYFVFSYVKMGMGKVICFEINPWSIEGLRKGAVKNGWNIKFVTPSELHNIDAQQQKINEILSPNEKDQIIVFQESNANALTRISELDHAFALYRNGNGNEGSGSENGGLGWGDGNRIVHVNCGLLPSSRDSWRIAKRLVGRTGGWLHLHENVAVNGIDGMRREIEEALGGKAEVEHVEHVKSFAPGVWHCVFDVYIHEVESG